MTYTDHDIHLRLSAQLRGAEEETSFCHTLKCGRGMRDFHATVVYYSYIQYTGDLGLHRHLAVPVLPSYIQWKMEDNHTYHNMKVHDNTIQK